MKGVESSVERKVHCESLGRRNGRSDNSQSGPSNCLAAEFERVDGTAMPEPRETYLLSVKEHFAGAGAKRLRPSSDYRQLLRRRLVAVLVSDVVEFPKLLARDETRTLDNLGRDRRERIEPAVQYHGGRVIKCLGDGMLIVFGSVVSAVECALDIQNAQSGCAASMPLRIGINLCDVILDGGDIYGHGVNIAFRVEGLAPPRGICITSSVHDSIATQIHAAFTDIGERHLRNINQSIHVFAWSHEAASSTDAAGRPSLGWAEPQTAPGFAELA